jgi:hypothetical protein
MKKLTVIFFILLLGVGVISGKEIEFAENYETALQLAGEKDQQLLVTFYTDW